VYAVAQTAYLNLHGTANAGSLKRNRSQCNTLPFAHIFHRFRNSLSGHSERYMGEQMSFCLGFWRRLAETLNILSSSPFSWRISTRSSFLRRKPLSLLVFGFILKTVVAGHM
jgi:hypothetical protein